MTAIEKTDFEAANLPWPDAANTDVALLGSRRLRFSRCTALSVQPNYQRVEYIPHEPQKPGREVPIRFEKFEDEDGFEDERAVEWRTLSDEEYAEALAKYEQALTAFRNDRGEGLFVVGQATAQASFVLEDGSVAILRGDTKRWWVAEHYDAELRR